MTPLHIHLMLHYHVIAEPVGETYCNSETAVEFTFQLKGNGLIIEDDSPSGWTTTPKGRTYVRMLLSTPLPVHAWIDPRTNGPVL